MRRAGGSIRASDGGAMGRRLAVAVVVVFAATAVLADVLASDRPLLLHLDGRLYVLPNAIDYDALAGRSGDDLRAAMDRDDWAVWPPVPYAPDTVRTRGALRVLEPPSADHWLGTDDRGRDVLARLIHGARTAAVLALGVAGLALAVGGALGAFAAWRRGLVDAAIMAGCDVVAAVPGIVVVVAAQGLIGRGGLGAMIALVALPRVAALARVVRAALAAALAEPYCDAARAAGASERRVVVRHALPHAAGPAAVATALSAATAVLSEAALGFVGFGAPPPAASWGELLQQAHENGLAWWLAAPAGTAIALAAAAFDGLAHRPRRQPLTLPAVSPPTR
ncbi:MAG: ABC transporter permease [Deltaproteobacteria bacterium]|nr:MAG: ABC transporter permease [Deltaproteobacteria bacterium]